AVDSELAALEIVVYGREKALPIGINYCSFFFKNRFQPAGFRKLLAKTSLAADNNITEKGFLREYTGSQITYKTFVISEKETDDSKSAKIQLADKTCYIKTETVMSVPIENTEQKKKLDELLLNEPAMIPADEFLFRIWQMEYIEKGLRDY